MVNQKRENKHFRHDLGKTGCVYLNASELIDLIQSKSTEWDIHTEDMIFAADVETGYYDDPAELKCYLEGYRLENDYEYELRIAIESNRDAEARKQKKKEDKARLDKQKQEEYATYLKLKSKFEK